MFTIDISLVFGENVDFLIKTFVCKKKVCKYKNLKTAVPRRPTICSVTAFSPYQKVSFLKMECIRFVLNKLKIKSTTTLVDNDTSDKRKVKQLNRSSNEQIDIYVYCSYQRLDSDCLAGQFIELYQYKYQTTRHEMVYRRLARIHSSNIDLLCRTSD